MSSLFRSHIRESLNNPTLQSALDNNAERRMGARPTAFASLPEDLQTMRQRARRVRADVIANLPGYLEQFITSCQANGILVHRAADASQAVQIFLDIARQHGAKLVSKSKTMVGEEIHFNPAVEQAGLRVVETDLGEYIVQLRGEPPSHIITPAVHLTRADVGRLFEDKLGLPYTDEIPILTTAARRVLRQTFLDTDIGVSGVNFGVAETGTLVVVTNEGNGRMVTTLPPVHVALMGVERLLPTLTDLALLLYLLPRSATGQKLSVYTSLIHGPRRDGELDGPHERHLILVDNGRLALRGTPLEEALYCVRCGACLNACPVFREIGGHAYIGIHGTKTPYPGPIGSVISPALFSMDEFGHLARASSLCGACKEHCPVDIDLPKLLLRIRSYPSLPPLPPSQGGEESRETRGVTHVPPALRGSLRLFTWVAESPSRFSAAQRLGGVFGGLFAASGWLRLPAFTGWGFSRDLPRPASPPFRARFSELAASPPPTSVPPTPLTPLSPDPDSQSSPPPTPDSLIPTLLSERFSSELIALGGFAISCAEADLPQRILSLLGEKGITTIQAWDQAQLPSGLLAALRAGGIQVSDTPDPSIRLGLTGAVAGIAETGTLLLAAGVGRPLTASLLPEIHLAVLRVGNIYENLAQVLSLREIREASAAALVSGPSRTADIEMTLTIGVHGPGELYVFLIE